MNHPALLSACENPGFTPSQKQLPEVLLLLNHPDRKRAAKVIQTVTRIGASALPFILESLAAAPIAAQPRLVELLGRLLRNKRHSQAESALQHALQDTHWKTRQSAIIALGKLNLPDSEKWLLSRWAGAATKERCVLAEALGKVGSAQALKVLSTERVEDPELSRCLGRARVMLQRTLSRPSVQTLACNVALPYPVRTVFFCRSGLGRLLAEELRSLATPEEISAADVTIAWGGHLEPLLTIRTAFEFGFEVLLPETAQSEQQVLNALRLALPLLRAWSPNIPRFRLCFSEKGHQRAKMWRLAEAVTAIGLLNDSRQPDWEVRVEHKRHPRILLIPRGYEDFRFSYREASVPAASHPTLAAALARHSQVNATDIVWDPFVGSGLELVEIAKLMPPLELHGSDLEPQAIEATRINCRAANVELSSLELADARHRVVNNVSLIITNPPMGRRVARDGTLGSLLDGFLRHARTVLVPKGRIVWLSPLPSRTARVAVELGLQVKRLEPIDMGGFQAELQVLSRLN